MTPYTHLKAGLVGGLLLAAFALAGCGGLAPQATPLPTRTPLPTFTPAPPQEAAAPAPVQEQQNPPADQAAQPPAAENPPAQQPSGEQPAAQPPAAEQATATPAVAEPPTAAPTNTPAPAEVTTTDVVNVRGGPGTNYNIIGSAQAGETFPVTGKSPAGDWWQINYNGQAGWVFAQLTSARNTEAVAVAQNIPAAPPTQPPAPPTNTPAPQPPQPPAEAQPTQPPANNPDNSAYPFILGTTEGCDPNPGITYFKGYVRDSNNNPLNAVCVHIAFGGPRSTKCSGCDGVGDGNWGFAPFGNNPAPRGIAVEIFVVGCPPNLPPGGASQDTGFGDLTPQSAKWTRVINDSEQCAGITFYRK
jgi:uncharacterized protein YraI